LTPAITIALTVTHILIAPLLVVGFIRKVKARLQNRVGPPLLQPFWDVAKLLGKGETISETATWAFRLAPIANLACVTAAAFMTPWLGLAAPIPGDLFLVVYILALGKFCMSLSSLDTGSSFGAFASSREAAVSVLSEPAMLLALAALAVRARSSSLTAMLTLHSSGEHTIVISALVTVALALATVAELSRMPIDDPTTHLELTMIHEAQILENSGRNLAIVEFAAALKLVVMLGLVGEVVLSALPRMQPGFSYLAGIAAIVVSASAIAAIESVSVKLRWRRVPNLMSFAVGAGIFACLLAALGG
jgi:formate hydrogenlyase subunit 4